MVSYARYSKRHGENILSFNSSPNFMVTRKRKQKERNSRKKRDVRSLDGTRRGEAEKGPKKQK
jgi:hypothetical protein